MGTDNSLSLNTGPLNKMETDADEFIPLLRKLSQMGARTQGLELSSTAFPSHMHRDGAEVEQLGPKLVPMWDSSTACRGPAHYAL